VPSELQASARPAYPPQRANYHGSRRVRIERIHHVAYRCRDARETVLWYKKMLNMDFLLAIAEDEVPSTGERDPYIHVFLNAGSGNILAFFELPSRPPLSSDPNTPAWVQHIAFEVKDRGELLAYQAHLKQHGVDVLGVIDHGLFHSIYFLDPNGHRIELACPDPRRAQTLQRLDAVKWEMLDEWAKTKRPPRHARFLHISR
jgi:catechol 2,3-dioxygenase-like lactoylglutathione lyase family enzyme